MRWSRVIPEDDIGWYLGFFTPAPWVLLGLFITTYSYIAIVVGGGTAWTPIGFMALLLTFAAATLLAVPAPTPLPIWRTTVIVLVVPLSVGATLTSPIEDPTAYASWSWRTGIILMYWLAIRARYAAAWIAEFTTIAVVCLWSVMRTGSLRLGLSLSYGGILTLLAVTVFAVGMHRTARKAVVYRTSERERADREARAAAGDEIAASELRIVRDLAGPTLEELAHGVQPDVRTVRSLEAALRDILRGRRLAVEPLVTALRTAREAGADILVLDDLGLDDMTHAQQTEIAEWASELIGGTAASTITIRVTRDDGHPRATVVIDGTPAGEIHVR